MNHAITYVILLIIRLLLLALLYFTINIFLPAIIRDWNKQNPDIRNAGTLDSFEHKVNQNLPVIPNHYYSGISKYQICTQEFDQASSDLFLKHIIDSPLCAWNSGELANAHYFFFIWQLYIDHRADFRQHMTQSCDVLLCGEEILSINSNSVIYEACRSTFRKSKRICASRSMDLGLKHNKI